MKARVVVTLKDGILDPQGKAIEGALKSLGVAGIDSLRQGKIFEIELATNDPTAAEEVLRAACEKLLANQVVENFQVEIFSIFASGGLPEQANMSEENVTGT
jgi:phosphoribosylformylglycinamidine synthase PurS subunit